MSGVNRCGPSVCLCLDFPILTLTHRRWCPPTCTCNACGLHILHRLMQGGCGSMKTMFVWCTSWGANVADHRSPGALTQWFTKSANFCSTPCLISFRTFPGARGWVHKLAREVLASTGSVRSCQELAESYSTYAAWLMSACCDTSLRLFHALSGWYCSQSLACAT